MLFQSEAREDTRYVPAWSWISGLLGSQSWELQVLGPGLWYLRLSGSQIPPSLCPYLVEGF